MEELDNAITSAQGKINNSINEYCKFNYITQWSPVQQAEHGEYQRNRTN